MRRTIGSLVWESHATPMPEGDLLLEIAAQPMWYHFSVQKPDGSRTELGKAETRHVSTELAGGFTGVFIGPYATANGRTSANHAHFDFFEYLPEKAV